MNDQRSQLTGNVLSEASQTAESSYKFEAATPTSAEGSSRFAAAAAELLVCGGAAEPLVCGDAVVAVL